MQAVAQIIFTCILIDDDIIWKFQVYSIPNSLNIILLNQYVFWIPKLNPVARIVFILGIASYFIIENFTVVGPFNINSEEQFLKQYILNQKILATYYPNCSVVAGVAGAYIDDNQTINGYVIWCDPYDFALIFAINGRSTNTFNGQWLIHYNIIFFINTFFYQNSVSGLRQ